MFFKENGIKRHKTVKHSLNRKGNSDENQIKDSEKEIWNKFKKQELEEVNNEKEDVLKKF